jgi:hypothetical protein
MNWTIRFAIAGLIIGAAADAHAEPAAAQAQVLFDQGIALEDAGKIPEACAAFDASEKLEPTISTLLNQAACRETNHQLATAWGLFLDAERQARAATDEPTRQLHLVAIEHAAQLEPRLSKLTVNVPPTSKVPGLELVRGNDVIDAGAWNHPLPLDGGAYTITARAPGYEPWSTSAQLGAEHDAKAVDVPLLKRAPVPVSAAPPARPVAALLAGAGAVVLLGGAIGAEAWASHTYGESTREPDDQKQKSLYDSANSERHLAIGLGVAGVASAGCATWLYVRHRRETATSAGISVAPFASSTQAGLLAFGHF